jgi:hypothetical protein
MLLTLYSDSESLLKRLKKSLSLTYAVPRRTLFSEADVELQILDTLAAFPYMPTLCHVEGHQGTKYPDRPLQWDAQLNQRCDKIATDHLEAATDILSTTTFFPASKASLTVGVTTLTHHIPSQLRFFAGLSAHHVYLCRHHHWTTEEYETISWARYFATTRKLSFLLRLFVIKWINDLLPFQQQHHKYKQSPSASCPSTCGCQNEDWDHFLTCSHPHRRQSWREFGPVLSALFERHKLDPSLRRVLLFLFGPRVCPDEDKLPL